MALRSRDRVVGELALFYAALAACSVVALTCVDFEGQASESHRFATVLFITTPMLVTVAMRQQVRATDLGAAVGGFAALAIYVAVGLGVASTVEWLGSGVAYRQCAYNGVYGWRSDRFYDVDCRRDLDARLGEVTRQTYVDAQGFYLWAGCHPIFAAAAPPGPGEHKVKVGGPWYGRSALTQIRRRLESPNDQADVVCLTAAGAGPNGDPACPRAAQLGPCRARGTSFRDCVLPGPALDALVRSL